MNDMTIANELAATQQALIIEKQGHELMRMKFELQKVQTEKASRLEDSLFSPTLYDHYKKVAEMLSKSAIIPTAYRNKPDDVFVAIAMGYQLGFSVEQALQDIAVINGRPCLWGDGLLALALNHQDCIDIREHGLIDNGTIIGYECTVLRRGHEPHTATFTLKDAKTAGLLGKAGAWTTYPTRMLQMRARAFAVRNKFADALRGLKVAEEEMDYIEGESIEIKPGTQVERLKQILKTDESISLGPEIILEGPPSSISEDQIAQIEILME